MSRLKTPQIQRFSLSNVTQLAEKKEQEEKVRLPSILLKMQYELKESPDTEPNLVQ